MIPILLVDDDVDMLDLMQLAFSESGSFEVTACLDARDAVEILKKQPIEVVISDYRMPVMNGGEVCQGCPGNRIQGLVHHLFRERERSPHRPGPSRWCGCIRAEIRRF